MFGLLWGQPFGQAINQKHNLGERTIGIHALLLRNSNMIFLAFVKIITT